MTQPTKLPATNPTRPTPKWVWVGLAAGVVLAGMYVVVAKRRYA